LREIDLQQIVGSRQGLAIAGNGEIGSEDRGGDGVHLIRGGIDLF
jgi:hypothetical protein